MYISSSGYVGIGTDSPGAQFHVYESANDYMQYTGNGALWLSRAASGYGPGITLAEDNALVWRMKIDADNGGDGSLV